MSLEQQVTALVEASNNLTSTVSGKIGEIDQRVNQAEQEFDQFVAGHMADIHPNSYTPNRLKNSQFEKVGDELAFWTLSGGLTVEEVPYNHFMSWTPENPLSIITGLYTSIKKADKNVSNAELKYPKALRITNPSTDSVASITQKVTSLIRRDAAADVFSSIFLQVESGGVGVRRGYFGHEWSFSPYLCADGFSPLVKAGTGDTLKKFGVLSTDKMVVVDRMVDAHTGIFGLYLQPQTTIVIQAPMTYMSQKADIGNDYDPSLHYYNVTTQLSTFIAADGTAHYL